MGDKDSSTEKREVEEYMKLYCMEECLDEIMNEIIIERPTNPYVAMALLCESKTLPEIIDVSFRSILVGGELGVQANFTTNIATFTGIATYSTVSEVKELKDYTMLREKIRDAILSLDPVNVAKVDESIAKLAGVDPAESLALSIACVKAGARHKGKKLYQYIANLAGLKEEDICIPSPVVSILSRIVEGQETQDITLTSTKAGSFASALEALLQCSTLIAASEGVLKPRILSTWGSPCVNSANISAAAKVVHSVLVTNDLAHDLKQGLHVRSELLLKQPLDPVEPVYQYLLDGPALPPRTGNDTVEVLSTLWQEVECISMEDAVFESDVASVHYFAKRTKEIAYDLKAANSDILKYNTHGVGGDAACHLQVPLDGLSFSAVEDLDQLSQDTPYNCVKVQLSRFPSVSRALEVVRKARAAKWPVVLVSNSTNTYGAETNDTFQADLAVGVGACQFMMGGFYAAECAAKYNRMMEISEESPQIRYVGSRFRK